MDAVTVGSLRSLIHLSVGRAAMPPRCAAVEVVLLPWHFSQSLSQIELASAVSGLFEALTDMLYSNLTRLALLRVPHVWPRENDFFQEQTLCSIAKLSNLRSLTLDMGQPDFSASTLSQLSALVLLESLQLLELPTITVETKLHFISHLSRITRLVLGVPRHPLPSWRSRALLFDQPMTNFLPNLRFLHVDIDLHRVGSDAFRWVHSLYHLESLHLGGALDISSLSLPPTPSLRCISLEYFTEGRRRPETQILSWPFFNGLVALRLADGCVDMDLMLTRSRDLLHLRALCIDLDGSLPDLGFVANLVQVRQARAFVFVLVFCCCSCFFCFFFLFCLFVLFVSFFLLGLLA